MTPERKEEIIQFALRFLRSNLDDALEDLDDVTITEDELNNLIKE